MSTDEIPVIAAAALEAAYAEAVRCYPEEACGLLIGPSDAAFCDEARPCKNQQGRLHALDPETYPRDARTAYQLSGADILSLSRSLGTARPVKIIFHSHVEVGAYFSAEDRRAALLEDELAYPVDYLVIDCVREGVRGSVLFRYRGGDFVPVAHYGALK